MNLKNINTYKENSDSTFDINEKEQLVKKYVYLVKHVAARISLRLPDSVLFDDLISAGCIGLMDAIEKYDSSKNVKFKTYAEFRIKGAILDELRGMDTYSRGMRKKIKDIDSAVMQVEKQKECPAKDIEIAKELRIDINEYYKMVSDIHGASVLRLDDFMLNKNNENLKHQTFKESLVSNNNPSDELFKKELKRQVILAILQLTKKEQMVLSLYYTDDLTLKEIGFVMELTESRICQIHSNVLNKLRNKLESYYNKV
jgi:RNA polymerase sigma factor for flagellar operon FliA